MLSNQGLGYPTAMIVEPVIQIISIMLSIQGLGYPTATMNAEQIKKSNDKV